MEFLCLHDWWSSALGLYSSFSWWAINWFCFFFSFPWLIIWKTFWSLRSGRRKEEIQATTKRIPAPEILIGPWWSWDWPWARNKKNAHGPTSFWSSKKKKNKITNELQKTGKEIPNPDSRTILPTIESGFHEPWEITDETREEDPRDWTNFGVARRFHPLFSHGRFSDCLDSWRIAEKRFTTSYGLSKTKKKKYY